MRNIMFISILLAHGAVPAVSQATDNIVMHRGSVTIDFVRGRGLAFAIDIPESNLQAGGSRAVDGIFDYQVVLESYGLIPPEFPIVLEDAMVAVSAGRAVVVEVEGPRRVDFVVDNPQVRGVLDAGLPQIVAEARGAVGWDDRLTFHGFGISHGPVHSRVVDDGSGQTTSLMRDACAGGSVSCSISCTCPAWQPGCASSCSTTCAANYEACCQCTGSQRGACCRCVPVSSGGGGGGSGGGGACSGGGANGCPAECFNCTQAI